MKVLELFAGTQSFSKVARERGHETFTSDIDPYFDTDYTVDVMDFSIDSLPWRPDFIWASPPCETFSVASIGHHWRKEGGINIPKTQAAVEGIMRVQHTIALIEEINPQYFVIENPRGVLRKMTFMNDFSRYSVTYCQYGDTRMKPTDLWTNLPDLVFKSMCKNGDPCHEAAPRGSQTGTQGLRSYREKSRIPSLLCRSIIEQVEAR